MLITDPEPVLAAASELPPVLAADGGHRAGGGGDRTDSHHSVVTDDRGDGGDRRVGGGGDRTDGRDLGGGAVFGGGGDQRVGGADNHTAGGDIGKVESLGAAGATVAAARATALEAETLREATSLGTTGSIVPVARATVQEEDTLGQVASMWAKATCRSPVLDSLVDNLRPLLPTGGCSSESRVSMGLRFFAGGSYLDLSAIHGIGHLALYNSVWEFTDAVSAASSMDIRIPLTDPVWRARTAALFQFRQDSPFNNMLGAFDGIAIKQTELSYTEVTCVSDHYCRKEFYALNTQAMWDANFEFTWVSCLNPGSVHDATAFACSRFGARVSSASDELTAPLIAEGYCFVGEEAYVASELVAVPWPGRTMDDPWKDGYIFYRSSARIHI